MSTRPTVVWFGLDLRLAENPALWAAGGRIAMVAEQVAGQASGGGGKTGLAADHPNAEAVFWNRRYEPAEVSRDQKLKTVLRGDGLLAESFNGDPLFEPGTVLNKNGQPFQVFSAFWRTCLGKPEPAPPAGAPRKLPRPRIWPESLAVSDLGLEAAFDWAGGLRATWEPGEAYLRQVGWREFAYHLLFHHPESPHQPLRREFSAFPWQSDPQGLKAWQRGKTGYPLVDAGMRELWHTGWMHNRVRMVAASFLVKHLLTDWREGAAWFWDTLVDADLATNTLGWQWTADCGNWRACRAPGYTDPGKLRPPCSQKQGWSWARATRSRLWIMSRPAAAPWQLWHKEMRRNR